MACSGCGAAQRTRSITTASTEITPAGLGRLLQTGPVGALLFVVVGWVALTYGRPRVEAIAPFSVGGGRRMIELVAPAAAKRDTGTSVTSESPA